jgi:hypothetical protein
MWLATFAQKGLSALISDTPSRLFQPLTIESAPEGSKRVLERVKKDFGFIPNLIATFANLLRC